MPEPIRMTRAEYEAKYGVAPVIPSAQPVKMTRAEYEAKYGVAPEGKPKKKGVYIPGVTELSNVGIGTISALGKTVLGIPEGMSRLGGKLATKLDAEGFGTALTQNADKIKSLKENIYQKPFEQGLDTVSGQVGNVAGNILPYLATGGGTGLAKGASLVARIAAGSARAVPSALVAGAQSGGDAKIMGAVGLTSAVANTIVPGSGGFASKVLRTGTVPGYVGDVSMGLAGGRGEDRGGVKALIPGLGTALGTTFAVGANANMKPVLDFKNRAVDTISKDATIAKEKLIGLKPGELKTKVVLNASQKNVTPLMSNAVKALVETPKSQINGASNSVKDPLKLYNEFAKMEDNFKVNTHADTAAGLVGERTGKAFDTVVKTRQKYGKVMGEELKKVGGVKLDATSAVSKHLTNLSDSGVVLSKKGLVPTGAQSKFTTSELKQLNAYTKALRALGKNPSVADIDGFLARTSSDLNLYKAQNNILSTTNAERIIKGSLNDLRTTISSSKVPELSRYVKARSNYSKLSDFLDDGISFLGKKTASGDYAKDASLVKSSVQSILNGGKKDWLIQLEKLTGYNALDEGVIAFQAMKDAGNFRGQSMLDLLTPKEIPTSASGVVSRITDFALQKGTDALTGSPADQTRRVIQDILSQKTNAVYSTTNPIASGGAITSKIPNNSNSAIPPSIQQLSPEVQRFLKMKGKAQ